MTQMTFYCRMGRRQWRQWRHKWRHKWSL